jgi:hypothetical protein
VYAWSPPVLYWTAIYTSSIIPVIRGSTSIDQEQQTHNNEQLHHLKVFASVA